MPSFGSLNIIAWNGAHVPGIGLANEKLKRPGVSGVDVRYIGIEGKTGVLKLSRDETSAANQKALIIALHETQGQVVSVVDNMGQTWTNLLVDHVEITKAHEGLLASGGVNGGKFFTEAEIRFFNLNTYFA